jgi:hypothetical protein
MIDVQITGEARMRRALSLANAIAVKRAIRQALEREAQLVQEMLVNHLRGKKLIGKRPAKLEPTTRATRAAKGNSNNTPLLDRGELIAAIQVKRAGDSFFVGVSNSARNRRGYPLARLGQQLEEGTIIAQHVTPGVIAKLREMGVPRTSQPHSGSSGDGIMIIVIRPRPWLAPVRNAYGKDPGRIARVHAAIAAAMARFT